MLLLLNCICRLHFLLSLPYSGLNSLPCMLKCFIKAILLSPLCRLYVSSLLGTRVFFTLKRKEKLNRFIGSHSCNYFEFFQRIKKLTTPSAELRRKGMGILNVDTLSNTMNDCDGKLKDDERIPTITEKETHFWANPSVCIVKRQQKWCHLIIESCLFCTNFIINLLIQIKHYILVFKKKWLFNDCMSNWTNI